MTKPLEQKRFTVSLNRADYDSLMALSSAHRPPLTLNYVVGVAVKNLLDRQAARQLKFPLDE